VRLFGLTADQEDHQIHDVSAGGAGDEKITELLKEIIRIVVGKVIGEGNYEIKVSLSKLDLPCGNF